VTRALRYFLLLHLQPPYALVVLVAVTTIGAWSVVLSPAELDTGLGMVLFVQMFLASSGFVARARVGHFDPLLAAGCRRAPVAAAHWAASALPGMACWFALAALGFAMNSPAALSAAAGRRLAAMLLVSSVSWSAGYALPRGAAGLAWIAVLVTILLRHVDMLHPAAAGAFLPLRHAAMVIACPFVLVGAPAPFGNGAVGVALCLAAALLVCTWRIAVGLDVSLQDR